MLSQIIQTAFKEQLVDASHLENVIIDSTVRSNDIPNRLSLTRSSLLSSRKAAKECGLSFKQTFAKEAKNLKRKASGYAHVKQFRRFKNVI